ncbi:hypothetical protein FOA52_015728 [Chlamydomonas sp. UWO 241]|nr:hypothetical protein FOA52_015728 [Chlamydomonas sp. UWO 241]
MTTLFAQAPLEGKEEGAADYWLTAGPARQGTGDSYQAWSHCGPAFADVVSSISIVSRDDATMSRLCKVDIRTRGQQSYSFGEHCDGGLPQTLELWPGEQILNVVDAFVASEVVPDPGGLAAFGLLARPFVQVDALFCLLTSYGDKLESGRGACANASNLGVGSVNSGLLAGIGGSTMLDEQGREYLSSLYLIFHPWPETIEYDMSTIKLLDPPRRDRESLQTLSCSGKPGYCAMQPSGEALCSVRFTTTKAVSMTLSDSVSNSFGVALSDSLTRAVTDGQSTGVTNEVSLNKGGTHGVTVTKGVSDSTGSSTATSQGVVVTKARSSGTSVQNSASTASIWSDSTVSAKTSTFNRSTTNEGGQHTDPSRAGEASQGAALSELTTAGSPATTETGQTVSREPSGASTRSEELVGAAGTASDAGNTFSLISPGGGSDVAGGSNTGSSPISVVWGVAAGFASRRRLLSLSAPAVTFEYLGCYGHAQPWVASDASALPQRLVAGAAVMTLEFCANFVTFASEHTLFGVVGGDCWGGSDEQLATRFGAPPAPSGIYYKPTPAWKLHRDHLYASAEYLAKCQGSAPLPNGTTVAARLGLLGPATLLRSGPHLLAGPALGAGMVPGLGIGGGSQVGWTGNLNLTAALTELDDGADGTQQRLSAPSSRRRLHASVGVPMPTVSAGTNTAATEESSKTTDWSSEVSASASSWRDSSSSLSRNNEQTNTNGFSSTRGSTFGQTASSAQAFTSSKMRTTGINLTTTASESNTLTTGWSGSQAPTTTGTGVGFSTALTNDRGGSVEQQRSVGYGTTTTASESASNSSTATASIVSGREISETSAVSQELSESSTDSRGSSITSTMATMLQGSQESSQQNTIQYENSTGFTVGYEITIDQSLTQKFDSSAQKVSLLLQVETYQDSRFTAYARLSTRGFGGSIRVPVTGVFNGQVNVGQATVDVTERIDCGGPAPEAINFDQAPFYSSPSDETLLYFSPTATSYRHAYLACQRLGDGSFLLQPKTQFEQEAAMAALQAHQPAGALTAHIWGGMTQQPAKGWTWNDGETFQGFFDWSEAEPDKGSSACLSLRWRGEQGSGRWVTSDDCSELRGFICEVTSEACPPGTAGPGLPECNACTGARYSSARGQAQCSVCSEPLVTNSSKGTSFMDNCVCPAGFQGSRLVGCRPCSSNTTYSDTVGTLFCKTCLGTAFNVEALTAPGGPEAYIAKNGHTGCFKTQVPTQPSPPQAPTQAYANCSELWDEVVASKGAGSSCGDMVSDNWVNGTDWHCATKSTVTRCVSQLTPLVNRLVAGGCCAQLSRLVEAFRPSARPCVATVTMPMRHAFGFFHESAGCNGMARLVNGWQDGSSGRVEVCHEGRGSDGKMQTMCGTVCDDLWNDDDASVVCRELGFDGGYAEHSGTFGPGFEWQKIWMHRVRCDGSERRLSDCPFYRNNTWGLHTCSHWEDAGATCFNSPTARRLQNALRLVAHGASDVVADSSADSSAYPPTPSVLPGEVSYAQGRLEIWHNLDWGTICDNFFTRVNADVACRQLHYHAGHLVCSGAGSMLNQDPYQGPVDPRAIWLAGMDCYGDEMLLSDCTRNAWGHYGVQCTHANDVVLRCANFEEGFVRLVDGNPALNAMPEALSGTLEVLLGGQWVRPCTVNFTPESGSVACRQLGYSASLIGPKFRGLHVTLLPPAYGVPLSPKAYLCHGDEPHLLACPVQVDGPGYECSVDGAIQLVCWRTAKGGLLPKPPAAVPATAVAAAVAAASAAISSTPIAIAAAPSTAVAAPACAAASSPSIAAAAATAVAATAVAAAAATAVASTAFATAAFATAAFAAAAAATAVAATAQPSSPQPSTAVPTAAEPPAEPATATARQL